MKKCLFKIKECKICGNKGHKIPHRSKKSKRKNNFKKIVHCTFEQKAEEIIKRKYINIQMKNNKIKFQLDIGSDITMINAETWKSIYRLILYNSKNSRQ